MNTKLTMLSEHRVLQFSLVLLVLAFILIGYMAYLNAKLREQTQVVLLDEYSHFIAEQFELARYEKSFEIRQKYYTQFMGALTDAWNLMNRQDVKGLNETLHELAKSYYGLEPFLDEGGRHYLQKRIAMFHKVVMPLAKGADTQRVGLEDKKTVNEMIEDFQTYLYPQLFPPPPSAK